MNNPTCLGIKICNEFSCKKMCILRHGFWSQHRVWWWMGWGWFDVVKSEVHKCEVKKILSSRWGGVGCGRNLVSIWGNWVIFDNFLWPDQSLAVQIISFAETNQDFVLPQWVFQGHLVFKLSYFKDPNATNVFTLDNIRQTLIVVQKN